MNVVIVGHGPSLKESRRGAEIDGFDRLARIKNGWRLVHNQERDYGRRQDIVVSSLKTCRQYYDAPVTEYWGVGKFASHMEMLEEVREKFGSIKVVVHKEAIDAWIGIYRKMGAICTHELSTGLGAIITACEELKPKIITLAGFDNMLKGTLEDYKSVLRKPNFRFPDHAWSVEKAMLPLIEQKYGVEIRPL